MEDGRRHAGGGATDTPVAGHVTVRTAQCATIAALHQPICSLCKAKKRFWTNEQKRKIENGCWGGGHCRCIDVLVTDWWLLSSPQTRRPRSRVPGPWPLTMDTVVTPRRTQIRIFWSLEPHWSLVCTHCSSRAIVYTWGPDSLECLDSRVLK